MWECQGNEKYKKAEFENSATENSEHEKKTINKKSALHGYTAPNHCQKRFYNGNDSSYPGEQAQMSILT